MFYKNDLNIVQYGSVAGIEIIVAILHVLKDASHVLVIKHVLAVYKIISFFKDLAISVLNRLKIIVIIFALNV